MSQTYGELRMRLSKLPHGAEVDPDILDGYINDRYQEMLAHHPWTRLVVDTILETAAKYDTGTVAIVAGSNNLTGTGTTWTAAMTGRSIRINNQPEFYVFTYVSSTSATIDRGWEHDDVTVAAYRIWQAIYSLPSLVDFLKSIKVFAGVGDIDQVSQERLDFIAPQRSLYGRPQMYAPYDDNAATGVSQVELYPAPEVAEGLPVRYRKRVARFAASDTSATFLPWISEPALFSAVEADLLVLAGELTKAQANEAKYEKLLMDMVRQDNQRIVPEQLRMADRFVAHRAARANREMSVEDKRRRMP